MAKDQIIKIGVLSKRGDEMALAKWRPTADYLSKKVHNYQFKIIPLNFQAIIPSVTTKQIDFILANPSIYADLEMNYGVSRIVTLKNNVNGTALTSFGGVIFTRQDNQHIFTISDLINKRFMAVSETSLGGFQMAWREMTLQGIDPYDDFAELQFAHTHDAVVNAVLNKKADAGTVRTDTLERMAQENLIDISDFRVIGAKNQTDFPFLISTRRYPEWPLAKLAYTDASLADKVAAALLAMPSDSEAAIASRSMGWSTAQNYQQVHQILKELMIGPYSHLRKISLNKILKYYWHWILAFTVLLFSAIYIAMYVAWLNKSLRQTSEELKIAHTTLEKKVIARTRQLNLALNQLDDLNQEQSVILNTAAEGIYGINLVGETTFINDSARQMLGYTDQELIGKINHPLIHHSHPDGSRYPETECKMYRAISENKTQHVRGEVLWRKDGSCFPVEYTSTPILKNDKPDGAVITFRDVSEREQAKAELSKSQAEFEAIFNANVDAILFVDIERRIQTINPATTTLFGYTFTELAGNTTKRLYASIDDYERLGEKRFNTNSRTPHEKSIYQMRYIKKDGSLFIGETIGTQVWDKSDNIIGYLAIVRDVTARTEMEEQLRLAAIAMETSEAIMITDPHNHILQVNNAFSKITGYASHEVIGQKPSLLKSDRHNEDFYQALWEEIQENGQWEGEIWNRRKNGEVYPEWLTITCVKNKNDEVTHYVGSFLDITARKESEAKIKYQAHYDPLTNLPNRRLLQDRLEKAISMAERHGWTGAILFLDLDHFKNINDSLGHPVGDALLQEVAKRLKSAIRKEDTAARLGGDEFIILLSDLSGDLKTAIDQANQFAQKILNTLTVKFDISPHQLHISTSIGISLFPDSSTQAEDIMKYADVALYQAKNAGRNTHVLYMPDMQEQANERLVLERELYDACENEQLTVFYQPQHDNQGDVIGAEALLRWHNVERGWISPADFIPLAEETGLILTIGNWVLKEACQLLKTIENDYRTPIRVAVNVSPRQFRQSDFVDSVTRTINETGANPKLLELELTEGMLISDIDNTIKKIEALRALGIRFAIDDFGTGYSSLAYLKRLPLDILKVDKSFVQDICTDPNDAAIVETIISMARHLDLEVIAEGVENELELEFLFKNHCNIFQGFYFNKPMPVDKLYKVLQYNK